MNRAFNGNDDLDGLELISFDLGEMQGPGSFKGFKIHWRILRWFDPEHELDVQIRLLVNLSIGRGMKVPLLGGIYDLGFPLIIGQFPFSRTDAGTARQTQGDDLGPWHGKAVFSGNKPDGHHGGSIRPDKPGSRMKSYIFHPASIVIRYHYFMKAK